MKRLFLAAAILAAAIWGFWFIAITDELITDAVKGSLNSETLAVELAGFEKGLFFNYRADALELWKSEKRLLSVEGFSGGVDFRALLSLGLSLRFEAGAGTLRGKTVLSRKHTEVVLDVKDAPVDGEALQAAFGLRVGGRLDANLKLRDGQGEVKFMLRDAIFPKEGIAGIALPPEMLGDIRGAVLIKEDGAELESVAIEGKSLYARVKGTVRGGVADLRLEVMPEGEVDALTGAFLERYRVSGGYYVIPLRLQSGGRP